MLFCKNCGASVEANVKFCEKCFTRLDQTNVINTVDEYEFASSMRKGDDFSPDAYIIHNDLSGETIKGFRLIEYMTEVAGSDFYRAARQTNRSLENRTVQHMIMPESQGYDVLLFSKGFDKEKADEGVKACAYAVGKEIAEFSPLCQKAEIPCAYEDYCVFHSERANIYHVFILMKPVVPLWQYIMTNIITLRDIIKWGINLCSQLLFIERVGENYNSVDDTNIYFDENGNIFLGSRLPEIFSLNMYLGAYALVRSIYSKPEGFSVSRNVYGVGMLLYMLLNRMKHPYMAQYQSEISQNDFLAAEKLRTEHRPTRLPIYSENSLGKNLLRTFSDVDEHVITLSELHRILSNSLNYVASEELSKVIYSPDIKL